MDARLARPLELKAIQEWLCSNKFNKVNLRMYFTPYNKILFIRGFQGKEMGVVFFEPEEGELALLVNPEHIGKGYGFFLLMSAHEWIRRYYPKLKWVWADCVNDASRALFEEYGYTQDLCGDYFHEMPCLS